jgi:hypothetical protein
VRPGHRRACKEEGSAISRGPRRGRAGLVSGRRAHAVAAQPHLDTVVDDLVHFGVGELAQPIQSAGERLRNQEQDELARGEVGVGHIEHAPPRLPLDCAGERELQRVATIRRWWQLVGRQAYPQASRLLVTADAGGSNGYRSRLWKVELGKLAAETGLAITVCHFPPGTSKWNRIEHRLFSQISMNWRGRPLVSHQVIVDLIGKATTRTGLRVHAELDRGSYPTGVKVSNAELAAVPLTRHDWHGEWNYTIAGATPTTAA